MYAIDENGEEVKRKALEWNAVKIKPFKASENEYQYFDLNRIFGGSEFPERQYKEVIFLILKHRCYSKRKAGGNGE